MSAFLVLLLLFTELSLAKRNQTDFVQVQAHITFHVMELRLHFEGFEGLLVYLADSMAEELFEVRA